MTYIIRKCNNCGYTYRKSQYGFVNDPIGVRLVRCPSCRAIIRNTASREWIQMGPWRRYFAIHPRGDAFAFFLGLPLMVVSALLLGLLRSLLGLEAGEELPGVLMLPMVVLPFVAAHYFLTWRKANSEVFCQRYCRSILRTRNEGYRKLLAHEGQLYDESIPSYVPLSKKSKERIENYLRTHAAESNFSFPTIPESIHNV